MIAPEWLITVGMALFVVTVGFAFWADVQRPVNEKRWWNWWVAALAVLTAACFIVAVYLTANWDVGVLL